LPPNNKRILLKVDYKQLTDAELLDLLKSDDAAAFDQIYDRTASFLLKHTYNKLRNRGDARDLVQDIYGKLWANRATQEIDISLIGFLLTSFRKAYFNLLIHQRVKQEYLDSLAISSTTAADETDYRVRSRQLIQQLEREIMALPKELQEVFNLVRNYNMSYKEVAKTLGISLSTVVTRTGNTKTRLRKKFGGLICFLWAL